MQLSELTKLLQDRIDAAGGSGLGDAVIKFDISGLGALLMRGDSVEESDADAEADTTVSIAIDDLENLLSGNLNPAMAFMMGKLKVSGNTGLAMKLQNLLEG